MSEESTGDAPKRSRKDASQAQNGTTNGTSTDDAALAHARTTAAYIPFLSPENLLPPKMPTREEMEAHLLGLRKKALVEEYFGDEQ